MQRCGRVLSTRREPSGQRRAGRVSNGPPLRGQSFHPSSMPRPERFRESRTPPCGWRHRRRSKPTSRSCPSHAGRRRGTRWNPPTARCWRWRLRHRGFGGGRPNGCRATGQPLARPWNRLRRYRRLYRLPRIQAVAFGAKRYSPGSLSATPHQPVCHRAIVRSRVFQNRFAFSFTLTRGPGDL